MITRLFLQPGEALRVELHAAATAIVAVEQGNRALVPGSVDLTIAEELVDGAAAVLLSGGSEGEVYLVSATIAIAGGETVGREVEVRVFDATWTMPNGGAPMLTIAEFVQRFGIEETVRMTDIAGDGRIDRDFLISALVDGQSTAELHLAARYALPLVEVPQALKMTIADIARGRLYPNGAPEGVEKARAAAIRTLEKLQSGALPLPVSQPATTVTDTPILISPGVRRYPDALEEF